MKELDVKERLDGMINRCLKQLLTEVSNLSHQQESLADVYDKRNRSKGLRDDPRRLNLHACAVPLRRWTGSNSAEPAADLQRGGRPRIVPCCGQASAFANTGYAAACGRGGYVP